MTNASGLVQHDVAAALERALREHGGSGGANQETAAMRGVIDFLKKYMKHGGKTTADAKSGGAKMRGEAATLALQAIAFANQCGGVNIKFNTDGQDVMQEDEDGESSEDEAPTSSQYAGLRRPHDSAVSEKLVDGEQLYGRAKYLEKYKLEIYYEEQNQELEAAKVNAENNPMKEMILKGIETERIKLAKEKTKCQNMLKSLNTKIAEAQKSLIKDTRGEILLKPEGCLAVPLPREIVMIDENRNEYYHDDILPKDPSLEEEAPAPAPAAASVPATPVAHNSSDDDDEEDEEEEVAAAARPAARKRAAAASRRRSKKQK